MFSKLLILLLLLSPGIHHVSGTSCPSPCKCSRSLKTVDCSGRGLTAVPSSFPAAVEKIKLSHNRLTSINEVAFTNLSNLISLDLSTNKLGSLSSRVFDGCPNLIELHLIGNVLSSLNITNLPKLQILEASQNHLTAIPNLSNIGELKYLYLGNNLLQSLHFPPEFSSAKSLQRITLSNNGHVSSIIRENFESLSNLTQLTRLYLSRCDISRIDNGSFGPIAGSLASLSLSQNPIDMDALQNILTDFANCKKLASLDLSGNHLSGRITNETFKILGSGNRLSTLDLSSSKYISSIDSGAFSKLPYLVSLKITQSGITTLPNLKNLIRLSLLDVSQNSIVSVPRVGLPSKLVTLHLYSNRLKAITGSLFSEMSRLTTLRLDSNSINTFTKDDLIGLSTLSSLNMSYNQINAIPNDVFTALGNITTLDLSHNTIKYINNTVFSLMGRLKELDLSNNNLYSFNRALFSNLVNLTALRLSNNQLGHAFSDSSLNYKGFLAKLPQLQVVDLSSNGISRLPVGMVSGAVNLKTLNFGYNNLNSWESASTLQGLKTLKLLLLNDNNLAVLHGDSFSGINLTSLDLTKNPFACTCDMRMFRDWLKSTRIEIVNKKSYTCASPPLLLNTKLTDYDLNQIQCLPVWVWVVVGVSSGIILLLIIICVLYQCRWKIGYRLYQCAKSRRCCPCCKKQHDYTPLPTECNYAAFISHCREEDCKELVREKILPCIDNDPRYNEHRGSFPIVHEELSRVYRSDMSYYTSLQIALQSSASCIVLVCRHYKKDRKKQFELDQIYHMNKHIILLMAPGARTFKDTPDFLWPQIDSGKHIQWVTGEERSKQRLTGELAHIWNPSTAAANDDLFSSMESGRSVVSQDPIQPYYGTSEVQPLSTQVSVDSQ